jgi:uroporphyrinogen decarboxylase
MQALKNDRLLRAMRREPLDRTPIWIMRQAGRYLPEYRKIREKAGSFMRLCKTPELACEVTLQPLQRFPLDAAILFSDILTIPDAMGLGLSFVEGEGPIFSNPLRNERDIRKLSVPDPELSLSYVLDSIRLIRHELAGKVPLIGFCGSPWTLATYMIDGKSSKKSQNPFPIAQSMLQESPKTLHLLLDILAQSVSAHLNAQIAAGAQAVMIFDTWGGLLNTVQYQEFSLRYVEQVIANVKREQALGSVPVVLFTKGGGAWLESMAKVGPDVLGVDWLQDLGQARLRLHGQIALQGNMDPAILKDSPEEIRHEVARILKAYGPGSGHIFNLGHGITPDIDPEKVAVLVNAVHNLSIPFHQ